VLDRLPDPMPYYQGTQEKHMSITYERNMADPAYQEWIFADGQYIGEIYGGVLEGFELRKVKEIKLAADAAAVDLETIAYFDTVCDAKSFVNQAGQL
jgi:hypothetical protein